MTLANQTRIDSSAPKQRRVAQALGLVGHDPPKLAMIEVPLVAFDAATQAHKHSVLVRVSAFSLNYRDLAIVHGGQAVVIGSEFCAEVVDCGVEARLLVPGHRVMATMAWPVARNPAIMPGVATNSASIEWQIFHQDALVPVPHNMSDTEAAAFVLSAQTAFSMVRRGKVQAGESVLVPAATSNTGMALIQALRMAGAHVVAMTSRAEYADMLQVLGASEVFVWERDGPLPTEFVRYFRKKGSFAAIFDCFADLFLPQLIKACGFYGRYVFCGVADQGWARQTSNRSPGNRADLGQSLAFAIAKNIQLLGNCLGLHEDLEAALEAWNAGHYRPIVARTFDTTQAEEFGTYFLAGTGVGKPVLCFRETRP